MTTIAPDWPETAEETALLERLDPEQHPACAVPTCGIDAAVEVLCTRCDQRHRLCGHHGFRLLLEFEAAAALHLHRICLGCRTTFCTHRWREYVRIVPVGGGS